MTRLDDQRGPAADSHARRATSSRLRVRLWIITSVIALAGLTLAIMHVTDAKPQLDALSTLTGASGAPAKLTPGPAITPTPALVPGAAAAGPQSAAALGLAAGALPLPSGMKTQVAAWDAGRGGTALAAISKQLGSVTQSGAVREYVEMKEACSELATEIRAAQAETAIPEAAMQVLYAKALASMATGAADCQNAISVQPDGDELVLTHENATLLRQSGSALTVGAKELFQATAEIEVLRHS